ncbi:MAG TPA: MFS transporter [Actinomycetota bacterium]|nr:MFS transporter [Actinomycetota bacterium]
MAVETEPIRWGTAGARWTLAATVGGSGVAMLDATTVNVALPALGEDLGASVADLQWTINAYTLTVASLVLLAGSLADRFGRRRVFLIGVGWFAAASLLCALAPTVQVLILARGLQGIGGALLTPGSLAILQSSFAAEDRARAVGAWSGLGGLAAALGPVLGGFLVSQASWRWIFLINLPVALAVVLITVRHVPETRAPDQVPGFDIAGSILAIVALGATSWAFITSGERGLGTAVLVAGAVGLVSLLVFVAVERRSPHPLIPPRIFHSRQFTGANLVTFLVYGGMGGVFFLFVVYLQQVAGFSPVEAGSALLPITALMLLLSARAGALAQRIGPRKPMTFGPVVIAAGMLLMTGIGEGSEYLSSVLPAAVVFGLGLALTVAPLTAAVLAAAEDALTGVASGVNNAVSRAAGLLAVAVLPVVAGLSGDAYRDPAAFTSGFRVAITLSAALVAGGGVLAWFTITDDVLQKKTDRKLPPGGRARTHCAVDGSPLQPPPETAPAA